MSGSQQEKHRSGGADGFTLIELLVVLAIVAGLAAVGYAVMIPGYSRARAAYVRDDLERQLLELPQRVRTSGHGGILTSQSGENRPDGATVPVKGITSAEQSIEDWRVLRLALPAGWVMRVGAPIFYHFSGSCEGGEVVFLHPPIALRYRLAPPLCRPLGDDPAAAS
jgi:prepilin-type N-terminal cleavage/methylation domain-containing protein